MIAAKFGPLSYEHHKSDAPAARDDPGYHTIDGEILPGVYGPVADTLNRHHCISPEEDRDYARLFAAAPDLLAACRAWDEGFADGEQFDQEKFLGWVNERRRMARSAVAKATGGTP